MRFVPSEYVFGRKLLFCFLLCKNVSLLREYNIGGLALLVRLGRVLEHNNKSRT
jgi:hypothetical protein